MGLGGLRGFAQRYWPAISAWVLLWFVPKLLGFAMWLIDKMYGDVAY
jgi:hypothetical protein